MPTLDHRPGHLSGALLGILALAIALAAPLAAQPPTPAAMVREAIQNELHDDARLFLFAWKERKNTGTGTLVQDVVETPSGTVSRVVMIDDKPLDSEQLRHEAERIRKMLDPEQLARKRKENAEDDERTHRMLSAIPDAFDFVCLDRSLASNGHWIAHLKFTPRAGFSPPSREALVFTGMQGDLLLDENARRLVKIDGVLFKDVNFGWGILGKLYKGGRFVVEKAQVSPSHWETTHMLLHFDGKALLFKSIHIDDNDSCWNYRPVPPMTTDQAMNFLARQPDQDARLGH